VRIPRRFFEESKWKEADDICRQPNYVPPKRPYSFLAMLDDILCFAADHMVDNGRLSMWMPTANEDLPELKIPLNPHLELTSTGVQEFNKCRFSTRSLGGTDGSSCSGSRRLLTYRRIPDSQVQASKEKKESYASRASANELNPFRKKVEYPVHRLDFYDEAWADSTVVLRGIPISCW
jgi:tRNA (guanine10-N2)-methyltransferase